MGEMSSSSSSSSRSASYPPTTGNLSSEHGDNEIAVQNDEQPTEPSWTAIPQKKQLALIALARFVATAASGSLQSYLIFQLKSFPQADGSLPDTTAVALQMSVLHTSVAIPELFTSTIWGLLADHPRVGRKRVIISCLLAAGIASLGLGFTRSFAGAIAWRLLVGLANGDKPAMRSMIREISGERFESRAVLLLPAAFNLGSVCGPILGGYLAARGANAGNTIMGWSSTWPFLLPNAVNCLLQIACAAVMAFQLRETLGSGTIKNSRRRVSIVPGWAKRLYGRYLQRRSRYELLTNQDHELRERGENQFPMSSVEGKDQSLSFWTSRLILTLAARAFLMMHVFVYPSLLVVFASTPRYNPVGDRNSSTTVLSPNPPVTTMSATRANGGSVTGAPSSFVQVPPGYHPHAPFIFTGGLGFKPHDIGAVLAIRGVVGLLLQLVFFPKLRDVFGTLRLYRYALIVFPVTYFLTPYLATVASSTPAPLPASGFRLWGTLSVILVVQSTARSLALPAGQMLLNAACADRSVLGTVNGIGQSVSAAARVVGQLLLTGWLYGVGLQAGVVGAAWWGLVGLAILAAATAACVP